MYILLIHPTTHPLQHPLIAQFPAAQYYHGLLRTSPLAGKTLYMYICVYVYRMIHLYIVLATY